METIFNKDVFSGDRGNRRHSYYYYNYALYAGKLLIDGCYSTSEEALQFGYKNIPVQFETICLSTRDKNAASKIIKKKFNQDHT